MLADLRYQAVPAGGHGLLGDQGGTGELTRPGQAARVTRHRQDHPDLVGVQLGEQPQHLPQRHLGPGLRHVGDEMLLALGDLVGYLVVRDEAGAPRPDPGDEAGAAARSERRRPRCGGHAGKGTCRDARCLVAGR